MACLKRHIKRVSSVLRKKFIFAVLAASIGSGFQHGYHSGVINIPAEVLQKWIKKVRSQKTNDHDVMVLWSTTVAIFSIGGMFGGFMTHIFAERCGRRNGLLWSNLIALAAIALLIESKPSNSFELFVFGRFIAGVNAGLNSGLCQIYLIEISPDKIRGFVGGFYQLTITISILISQVVGATLSTENYWPFMLFVTFLPICLQLSLLPLCPESPKYLLITKHNVLEAEDALIWLRGTTQIQHEIKKLKDEYFLLKPSDMSLKFLLSDVYMRSRLAVSLFLNIGQQLCGINAVIYFSTEIFKNMNMSLESAISITIAISAVNIIATLVGVLIIDCIGRRIVLLAGFLGMALNTLLLIIILLIGEIAPFMTYVATAFILAFVVLFAVGIGIIPWFITGELFSHTARSVAVTITVTANWLFNFLVAQTFLPLQSAIGNYTFAFFIVFDVFFYFFTALHLPETARRSPKEIFEIYYE